MNTNFQMDTCFTQFSNNGELRQAIVAFTKWLQDFLNTISTKDNLASLATKSDPVICWLLLGLGVQSGFGKQCNS